MKPTRIGRCAVVSVITLVMVVGVVAAAPSTNRELFHDLNINLLYLAVPIILAVELILYYSVWKYRNNADDRQPTRENRRLELTWTLATAIVLIYVGIVAFYVLGNPYISPEAASANPNPPNNQLQGKVMPDDPDAVVVDLVAYRFGWGFTYAETNVTTQGTLVLPADTNVYIHLTAREVIHSFYVPSLGLKQDVIPGRYNTIRTKVTQPGTYQLYCAEFCGSGHARMSGNITVIPKDDYRDWLRTHKNKQENASAAIQ
jgi:cytochrome c oxidase subunit 2